MATAGTWATSEGSEQQGRWEEGWACGLFSQGSAKVSLGVLGESESRF